MGALAMRCFLLVGLALGSPAPQYSGSKSELTVSELGTIEDIFGSSGTYSSTGKQTSQLNGNKVIVQVVGEVMAALQELHANAEMLHLMPLHVKSLVEVGG